MNIFVTGGTGFVGSYFIRAALGSGHHIKAVRRSKSVHGDILKHEDLGWIELPLEEITSNHLHGIDIVVHFAAAGVSPQPSSSTQMINFNVACSCHLMNTAINAGVKRFVGAGTCHEYGESAQSHEKIPPSACLQPLEIYGASKAAAFNLMKSIARENDIEFFYGRIFTVYGDGQCELNFWPCLKKAAAQGRDFPMTRGTQISDFIHVEQVAEHFVVACERNDISAGKALVVNIGSGESMRLIDFARREWVALGGIGNLLPGSLPDRKTMIPRYVPDLVGLYP